MGQTRLEICIQIIKVLSQEGPLKSANIINKADLSSSLLEKYLDFLTKQGIVEEQAVHEAKPVYVVTKRGNNILRYFNELKPLPIIEDAFKSQNWYE